MRHIKPSLIAMLLAFALSPLAIAETAYVDLIGGPFETKATSASIPEQEIDFTTLGFRGDYAWHEHFAIEGEMLMGDHDYTVLYEPPFDLVDVDVDLRTSVAIFGRISHPVTERLSMQMQAGYGSMELAFSDPGIGQSGQRFRAFEGSTYSLGTKFDFTDNFHLRSDYIKVATDIRDSDAITFGAGVNLFQLATLVDDLRD